MVKPDSKKDYYGDLGVESTADLGTISKAYKRLAMQYHPDKNAGREAEATTQFQAMKEAYDVLKDQASRQKYDNERASIPAFQRNNRYQSGGNQRGNPWANVSTQFPPPPKAPTARANRDKPPPPSAGAQRYSKFETPRQSANATAQEGPEGRRDTYEAWERMRNNKQPPQPPPQPTRPRPGQFQTNYNASSSTPRRAQSSSGTSRKGFVPTTPGPDESPAPKGAYFTARKSSQAPPPPPRNPPHTYPSQPTNGEVPVDPLGQFRNTADNSFEPRISTPYASHGGERFDPFVGASQNLDPNDPSNLNRSRSTREPRVNTNTAAASNPMQRAGSDSNINSPQNQPFPPRRTQHSFATARESDSSSSDTSPRGQSQSRRYAKPRTNGANNQDQVHSSATSSESTGDKDGGPSMYGQSRTHTLPQESRASASTNYPPFETKLPTVSEHVSSNDEPVVSTPFSAASFYRAQKLYSSPFEVKTPPSGVNDNNLYPLEEAQHSVLNRLINNRKDGATQHTASPSATNIRSAQSIWSSYKPPDIWATWRETENESEIDGSPSKKQKSTFPRSSLFGGRNAWCSFDSRDHHANPPSFSIPVDKSTFQGTASGSTENINMKFSPSDWTGKFEGTGGASYFQPEQKAANTSNQTRSRTQSTSSRSRGRSPVKSRPMDPNYVQPEATVESPSAKFSQEEWAKTFKTPTFVAPPPPSTTAPSRPTRKQSRNIPRKATASTASVVDESHSSADKPQVFSNGAAAPPTTNPDAMDVDTPPVMQRTVPRVVPLSTPSSPAKRQATSAPSPTTATNTAALNVEFEELAVKDLLSTINLPALPVPPKMPTDSMSIEPYQEYMTAFRYYMVVWAQFDKQMLLHFITRKNLNNELGDKILTDETVFKEYRHGLDVDEAVLFHRTKAAEGHKKAFRDCAVVRAKLQEFGVELGAGDAERPRKKMS